ncbi:MAG: helix-turn-helix transcriptional regulator [Alphaproteobacteria bacterium]|nr:helix-turn-helix transcriptional regulator [Alphaproteobacteria bacterium]
MITSPTTGLSKPSGDAKISLGTLSYFRARNKSRVYNLVISEFQASGLSQTYLGRRLGMNTGQLSRYLSAPGNWTLDTLSDFLFAISGAEANYETSFPLDQAPRNDIEPEWVTEVQNTTPSIHTDIKLEQMPSAA